LLHGKPGHPVQFSLAASGGWFTSGLPALTSA
jgi:hypothetical protein